MSRVHVFVGIRMNNCQTMPKVISWLRKRKDCAFHVLQSLFGLTLFTRSGLQLFRLSRLVPQHGRETNCRLPTNGKEQTPDGHDLRQMLPGARQGLSAVLREALPG